MYGLDTEPKFKVGDRVRVVKDGFSANGSCHGADVGDTDTIIAGADDRGRFEGVEWFYLPHEIELVAPQPEIGDRVQVLVDTYRPYVVAGNVGVVHEKLHHGVTVKVDDGDGFAWFFNFDQVSPATPPRPAFLPGDKVRVTKHSGYFATGDVGEVERQADNGTVYLKHGSYQRIGLPIDAGALELVEAVPDVTWAITIDTSGFTTGVADPPEPKFKAGDVVAYIDGGKTCGVIDRVKTTYDDGTPFMGGQTAYDYVGGGWDFERSLKLASRAASAPCIVARIVSGTPRPSNIPYVHVDAASATTEAERLAQNNPGQEFAVYQRVAGRVAEVAYSMKEVA